MDRRNFIKGGLMTAGLSTTPHIFTKNDALLTSDESAPFNLKYAPHFGMFKNSAGEDLMDQIQFMADQGFRALEDNWFARKEVEQQEAIASKLKSLNMEMGVFVAYFGRGEESLTSGKAEHVDAFVKSLEACIEPAKRVGATWMTVIPGFFSMRLDYDYQMANVVEGLKVGAEVFEEHGLVMVLESLNPLNHPDHFLKRIPQAYSICKAVNSPAVKILDDLYHQQITEGNLIPNMDMAWDEIAYIQIGANPGRNEPTTGEINYKNVFKHIYDKGYEGILGMEHGNAREGKEGETALIQAYREVDSFDVNS